MAVVTEHFAKSRAALRRILREPSPELREADLDVIFTCGGCALYALAVALRCHWDIVAAANKAEPCDE